MELPPPRGGDGRRGCPPGVDQVKREAERRKVELLTLPTREAVRAVEEESEDTNAILHLTC